MSTAPVTRTPPPPPTLLVPMAIAGLVVLAVGLFLDPGRGMTALLSAGFLAVAAALGALALLALFLVSNAGFHVTFKRVLEALALNPVGVVAMLAVLPGVRWIYAWARPGAASDPLIAAKAAYLNVPGFGIRMLLFLGIWGAFALMLRRQSLGQDADGRVEHTGRSVALAAVFLLLGGYTLSLASVDWLMSVQPHWASTIFGFYTIGSTLLTGTAVAILAVSWLRREGRLPEVNDSHLHDLGKLLFGFSTFWAYLWFSQYLLIWYANLPEETAYILARTRHGWGPLFYGNLVVGWVLPFLLLLPRAAKRTPSRLVPVAVLVLLGRFLDVFLQIGPATLPGGPPVPWVELGALVGVGAAFTAVFFRVLATAPLEPAHDPYLVESLHHHT
jgi:hypothetical protein